MAEPEMVEIATLIARVLSDPDNEAESAAVRDEVRTLCSKFPVYPG
jgi:glycine/serine hydroxymethyltransferase